MTRLDDAMKQELFYGKEECTGFRSLLAATTMPKLAVAHSLLAKYIATPVGGCIEAFKKHWRLLLDLLLVVKMNVFCLVLEMLLGSSCSLTVIGLVCTAPLVK